MTDTEMNPAASLAGYLCQTTPEQAVKAAMELCEQLPGDPERFHGGVWPGNVTLDGDGKAVLGLPMSTPAAQRPANQVEYLAPEFFWDGESSAAADVFSVGLMIYAGCNKGFLPFQPEKDDLTNQDRASALRRRMKGEAIPAPEGVSGDLKKVLEKALAYKPEDRYITPKELLFALHWTDEALGPEKDGDAAAAAVPAGEAAPEVEAAAVTAEEASAPAPIPEEPPVPEETAEEMLREADQVLAAAAAGLAAAGGAAVAAAASHDGNNDASAEGGETPESGAESPAEGDAPAADGEASPEGESPVAGGEASEGESAEAPVGEDASRSDEAAAAGAAGAAAAGAAAAGMAAAGGTDTVPAAKKEYKVRKDFEHSPDKKAPTVASNKKRKSKAVPILCGVAAAALLGGVGYMVFGNGGSGPVVSPEATEQSAIEAPPSPVVITPEPSPTAKPTAKPTATPKASPEASPSASPDASARPDDGTVIVTPAPGTLEGIVGTTGGTGTGTGSTGTGSGTADGAGTGNNTGTGNTGTGSGGNTGTGSSGTGTGGNAGTGGSGTGSGGGTSWGGGSGGGTSTTPTPGYTVSPADDTVYITGVGVNVRSGPGTSYPIIGSASTGYELKRTGISGNWSRVTFKGTTGYVSNTYLSTTNPTPSVTATPAPQETPGTTTPAPAPRYTVTGGDLTYADAKAQAQSSGGLTVIRSEDDFQAVARELNNGGSGVEYAWLGVEYDASGACWRWSDGSVLYTGDSHWASGSPKAGDDIVLLSKQDGSWKYVSLSSSAFDPANYAGKLGYVTGS